MNPNILAHFWVPFVALWIDLFLNNESIARDHFAVYWSLFVFYLEHHRLIPNWVVAGRVICAYGRSLVSKIYPASCRMREVFGIHNMNFEFSIM